MNQNYRYRRRRSGCCYGCRRTAPQGFDGELHLFSDEQHQPYERPPLSKAMLLDDNPQLQPILPAGWWREHNVQLHLGVTVQTLGRQTHQLVLADGQSYPWDRLLIATGAAARPSAVG